MLHKNRVECSPVFCYDKDMIDVVKRCAMGFYIGIPVPVTNVVLKGLKKKEETEHLI